MKKKICVIFGTRPEAIKLAPVILGLRSTPHFECHVCATAQHREMLDQVLDAFAISPDVDLDLMEASQSLARLTSRLIEALTQYIQSQKPDLVLVQGDTTTTFCAALAAFYNQVPIGHVEAGLRTGNLYSPWPEEANRILVSQLATLHFAPTATNRKNLEREGIPASGIFVTGNTGIDALFLALDRINSKPPAVPGIPEEVFSEWSQGGIVLITGHRRESFGQGFQAICQGIAELARRFPGNHFVYPVHLNPNVQEPVLRLLGQLPNVHLLRPLSYLPFVRVMKHSKLILTDSGGVQEEAPSIGKPVLVMRETTERPEAVDFGCAKLVGANTKGIEDSVSLLLTDAAAYSSMVRSFSPYGDGKAAPRILSACHRYMYSSEDGGSKPGESAGK